MDYIRIGDKKIFLQTEIQICVVMQLEALICQ
jgi:hypothetical protein